MAETTIQALEGYAALIEQAAQRSQNSSAKQHEYVHGGADVDVETESGPVPSMAKQARLYMDSIPDAVADLRNLRTSLQLCENPRNT